MTLSRLKWSMREGLFYVYTGAFGLSINTVDLRANPVSLPFRIVSLTRNWSDCLALVEVEIVLVFEEKGGVGGGDRNRTDE